MKGFEEGYEISSLISSLSKEKAEITRLLGEQIKRGDENAEKLIRTESLLAEAQARAHDANSQLVMAQHQCAQASSDIDLLRASTSWRITGPIRALKRLFSGEPLQAAVPVTAAPMPVVPEPASSAPSERTLTVPEPASRAPGARRDVQSSYRNVRIVWIGAEPDTPGFRYRVLYWAEAARAVGAKVTHHRLEAVDSYLDEIRAADIVVLWRAPWSHEVTRVVDAVRQSGAFLIFDIDDLMIEPRVVTTKYIDGIRSQGFREDVIRAHFELVRRTMLAADLCTATTHELASHFRVHQRPSLVMQNGFNETTLSVSRIAARKRRFAQQDGYFRIGYAGGSKTHQKDFAVCVPAVAQILRRYPHARLVVFHDGRGTSILDLHEFPELAALESQIEWRVMVPLVDLPKEMARFDVSVAPLEVGNFFCEAKSELKYFEAALVDVPTIASPTDPYRRAIRHGVTGFLADTTEQWIDAFTQLIEHRELGEQIAHAALNHVLWTFGPECRVDRIASVIDMALRGQSAARAFAFEAMKEALPYRHPEVPASRIVFQHDRLVYSQVTVVIPLFNYERYVLQALESVAAQTLWDIDLVVVDDCSTDQSLSVVVEWCKTNKERFNRVLVLQNTVNSKLGPTRNVGFDNADTPYVITLDADNRLLPTCAEKCLEAARRSAAAFVYPRIITFGADTFVMGDTPYDPARFIGGNFVDAMALISKAAWACVGGYENVPHGWEDYEFWCKLAERGLLGTPEGGDTPLAEYRIHAASMLRQHTNHEANLARTRAFLEERHPWLAIATDRVGDAMKDEPPPVADEPPRLVLPVQAAGTRTIALVSTNTVSSCRSCKNVRSAVRTEEALYGSVVQRRESTFLHCGLRVETHMHEVENVIGSFYAKPVYREVAPSDTCDQYDPAY
ncbi:glycosyltransferase [Caballeronia insecticola]|uniref:Glycosyl transferase family 2 n=1 Tax=Caballeronia insecticola TaxID=758793 RepID=R4WZN4_9BURK|nr:glycosyltransferase [Caballeronia insecticola]BAN23947.1 glycosyl transferase family 2 [Caballeronia insecticola]